MTTNHKGKKVPQCTMWSHIASSIANNIADNIHLCASKVPSPALPCPVMLPGTQGRQSETTPSPQSFTNSLHLADIVCKERGTATHNFFQINELLSTVIELCSWPTLTSLSNVDQRTRETVRHYLRRRISFFLSKFMPPTSLIPFFRILRLGGGSIAGGIVRCIMSVHCPQLYVITPSQLDILLSSLADRNSLGQFFQNLGYTLTRSGFCSRPFAAGCRYNELYTSVRLL